MFTRIDGENNDLPWEFTMHHYPTIIFFPAYRYVQWLYISDNVHIYMLTAVCEQYCKLLEKV